MFAIHPHLNLDGSHGLKSARIEIRIMEWDHKKETMNNFFFGSSDNKDSEYYEDLMIRCYVDKTRDVENMPYGTFGCDTGYSKPYFANSTDIDRMQKTLRRINNGLVKLNAKFGYAQNFAEYALRVCDVLKIKHVIQHVGGNSNMYSRNAYTLHKIAYAKQILLDMETKGREFMDG